MTPFPHRESPSGVPKNRPSLPAARIGHGLAAAAEGPAPLPPETNEPSELGFSALGPLMTIFLTQLRARWWAGLLAALVVGSGLWWLLLRGPTEATAETTLVAQNPLDKVLDRSESQVTEQREENTLRDQTAVMSSNAFRARLIASFSPSEVSAIWAPYLPPGAPAAGRDLSKLLAAKIDVSRERGRDLFVVRVRHYTPAVAVLVANRLAAEYIGFVQSEYRNGGQTGLAILQEQATALTGEIRALESKRREFRKSFGFISVEETQGVIGDRLRRINSALSDIRIQRLGLETQLREAERAIAASPTPFTNPILAAYGSSEALRIELARLAGVRDVLAVQYGPNHPKMVEVDRQAAGLQKNLEENFALALAELRTKVALATATENQLSAELAAAFNQSLQLDEQAGRFNSLGEELAGKTKAQAGLLEHIAETEVAVRMPASNLRVIEAAYVLDQSRRRKLLFAAILALAAAAFVTAPLALYALDGKLSAGADLERVLGKDLLGAIPRLGKIPRRHRAHVVRDQLDPAVVDSFLGIAGRIELSGAGAAPKTILVTSTLPGEGKSITVANLASAFVRMGRRTVIVDCDFRRSMQRTLHEVTADQGMLAWAARGFPWAGGREELRQAVGLTPLRDGSFLVPAGGSDSQPGRYLIAPQLGELFRSLAAEFDVILVDTPPGGVFQDALLLARFCSATILVGRDGFARTQQVLRVLREFDQTHAPTIGVVLNAFSPGTAHPGMAYRHSVAKYGYHHDAGRKVPPPPRPTAPGQAPA